MSNDNYTIDTIGGLRAQIAELQAELKSHELALKGGGEGYYEGELFAGSVSEVTTNRTNWRAVAEKLGPSHQLIAAHTKATDSVRLTVTARSKAAA